jgi:hypothetical protein
MRRASVRMNITPSSASVTVGATVQLSASAGSKWSSSNSSIATVSGSGLVKGVAAGSATITAKKGNQKATAAITVEAAPIPPTEPPPTEPPPTEPPPTEPPPTPSVVYVSDLPFVSESNGWGPVERDRSNGEQGANDGQTLTIAGKSFGKGLGVHAPSEVSLAVPAGMRAFLVTIGVDDEMVGTGRVQFEVWVDGTRRYQSSEITGADGSTALAVDVTNATTLSLRVTGGADIHSDHADWADARFTVEAVPEPTPPPSSYGPTSGITCA